MLDECAQCAGVWLDTVAFAQVCRDREMSSDVFGSGSPLPAAERAVPEKKVSYVHCPVCSAIMNRVNFAGCSGVIVDVCRGHGTWFDRDELRQVVEFIRGGGMVRSLAWQREELEVKRREVAAAQAEGRLGGPIDDEHHGLLGELLDFLIR